MEVSSKENKYQVGITPFQSLPSLPKEYERDREKAYEIVSRVFQDQRANKNWFLSGKDLRKYRNLSEEYTKKSGQEMIKGHLDQQIKNRSEEFELYGSTRENSYSPVEKIIQRFLQWDAAVLKEVEATCKKKEKTEIKDLQKYLGKMKESEFDSHNQAKFLRKVSGAKVRLYKVKKEKKSNSGYEAISRGIQGLSIQDRFISS